MKKLIALATGLKWIRGSIIRPWPMFTAIAQRWNWQKWTPSHTSHFDVTHLF